MKQKYNRYYTMCQGTVSYAEHLLNRYITVRCVLVILGGAMVRSQPVLKRYHVMLGRGKTGCIIAAIVSATANDTIFSTTTRKDNAIEATYSILD